MYKLPQIILVRFLSHVFPTFWQGEADLGEPYGSGEDAPLVANVIANVVHYSVSLSAQPIEHLRLRSKRIT